MTINYASLCNPEVSSQTLSSVFCVQETVSGVILLVCKEALQHHGISLNMEGLVNLQLSSKSVGVFEAFYNSVKVSRQLQITSQTVCSFSQSSQRQST